MIKKNEEFSDGITLSDDNNIYAYSQKIAAQMVEKQEELIQKTINSCFNGEFAVITIDKHKTMEALTDYLNKANQLPRINKAHILETAINTFGIDSQVDMAIEEMSELTKALLKHRRALKATEAWDYDNSRANIIEEIADVAIMLKQLLMIYDLDGVVQTQVDFKIDRLGNRIEQVSNADKD